MENQLIYGLCQRFLFISHVDLLTAVGYRFNLCGGMRIGLGCLKTPL